MRTFLTLALAAILTSFGAFAQDPEPPSDVTLFADLSPMNVVPPVQDSEARGTAEIQISFGAAAGSTTFGTANFVVQLQGAQASDFTSLSIHQAASGQNGPEMISVLLSGQTGDTISGQIHANGSTEMEALAAIASIPGEFYLTLSTSSNPSGLLRGQLQDASDPNAKLDRISSQVDRLDSRLDTLENILVRVALALGIPLDSLPGQHSNGGNNGDDNN